MHCHDRYPGSRIQYSWLSTGALPNEAPTSLPSTFKLSLLGCIKHPILTSGVALVLRAKYWKLPLP